MAEALCLLSNLFSAGLWLAASQRRLRVIIGIPALRLKEITFAIITLGFAEIIRID